MLTSHSSAKELRHTADKHTIRLESRKNKMKVPRSLLVQCWAILAVVLISILTVHVQPAQAGWRQPLPPPSPGAPQGPGAHHG
ncbi:hypothetical protein BS78_08G052500 [Paspalum vaginatum]|nr:hypothetical protein BS78_08G052500 [Paspalum vaginatum]